LVRSEFQPQKTMLSAPARNGIAVRKQLVIATRGDGEIKPRSPLYQHFTRALSEMPKEQAGAGQISRASQSLPRKV
jgi:hypothetical protein